MVPVERKNRCDGKKPMWRKDEGRKEGRREGRKEGRKEGGTPPNLGGIVNRSTRFTTSNYADNARPANLHFKCFIG